MNFVKLTQLGWRETLIIEFKICVKFALKMAGNIYSEMKI